MSENCMLDLETLATSYNAAIVSIGAVKFDDETGEIKSEFLVNISMRDSIAKGFKVDPDTIAWWHKQKPEAVKAFLVNPVSVEEALDQFTAWFGTKSMLTWTNGMNFDPPILCNAYEVCGRKEPWKYYHLCDYRTIVNLSGLQKSYFDQQRKEMGTVYHSALDDCLFQTKMLIEMLK